MNWLIFFLSILTIGMGLQCYRLYAVKETTLDYLRDVLSERDMVFGNMKVHLEDYLSIMETDIIVPDGNQDELKLTYCKDYVNVIENLLTYIRTYGRQS